MNYTPSSIGLLIGVLLISLAFHYSSSTNYPQDYFRSPVDHTIRLSGTFGELRPNHFHSGIDIKAKNGKVGQPIYAIADGYVSRIKVQSGGYGNVLYINHPNGYTSVYAHLQSFDTTIKSYVQKHQYKRKSFEIDVFPERGQFVFKKGERIGKLGVSGRSFGPHLHFEIRDTKSEKPINPLLFGIPVADNVPPKLHQLKAYFLNDKLETLSNKTYRLSKTSKGYRISGDTLELGAWRVGFALKAFDHMTGTGNWNGIYSLAMYEDERLVYDFTMEKFAFSESRYINAHIDYAEQVTKKSYFNRCYTLPGNRLSIYGERTNNGVIKLHQGKTTKIKLIAADHEGNTAELQFWVKRGEVKAPKSTAFNYLLPYQEEHIIRNGGLELYFPKGSFYENVYLEYASSRERSSGTYSATHHVHKHTTPVHKYFTIAIQPDNLPAELKDKAFIAYCEDGERAVSCGGRWEGDKLKAKAREFGNFSILVDRAPPKIQPIRYQNNMRGWSKMTFKVTDNFPTARNVTYLDYQATIDGQWILLEYDAKKNLLTHYFDSQLAKGAHHLQLEVADNRGNTAILERTFNY